MNDFRTFKKGKNGEINFKIWLNDTFDIPTLFLTLSYHGTAKFPGEIKEGVPHNNFSVDRDTWMEVRNYNNVALVARDFEEAVDEFQREIEPSEIKNPASVYLLNKTNAFLESLTEDF